MKDKKVKVSKIDLDELKSIYIDMAKDMVRNDKDCCPYIFNKAIEDLTISFDRVNDLVKYSKERQHNNRPKKSK